MMDYEEQYDWLKEDVESHQRYEKEVRGYGSGGYAPPQKKQTIIRPGHCEKCGEPIAIRVCWPCFNKGLREHHEQTT